MGTTNYTWIYTITKDFEIVMKKLLIYSIFICNFFVYSQKCKICVINSNACFIEPEYDFSDCKEENEDVYYKWFGDTKNGLLDGKGILEEYDKVEKKLDQKYEVTFLNGLKNGIEKSYDKFWNRTEINYYSNGILRETNENLKNEYYSISSNLNYETGDFFYIHKGKKYTFHYVGKWDKTTKSFVGKNFLNKELFEEGTFKPDYTNELDISFPTLYQSLCKLEKGTRYLSNGVKIVSDNYINSLPYDCTNIVYPNGDYIHSCSFEGSIFFTGYGTYYWVDGRKYVGQLKEGKITKEGYFFDLKGNKNYGSFPMINNKADNLLGLAVIGLVAYGIYDLVTDNSKKEDKINNSIQISETKIASPTYSSSSSYTGSYSSYSSSSQQVENKCYTCNGRGVCLKCNGRGNKICWKCDGKGVISGLDIFLKEYSDPCTECESKGFEKCGECDGSGTCRDCEGKGIR